MALVSWISLCLLINFNINPVWTQRPSFGQVNNCRTNAGQPGQCIIIARCPSAIADLKKRRISPTICGFQGQDPIVCCVTSSSPTTSLPPVATTAAPVKTTTKKPYIPVYDYINNDGGVDECEPIAANLTAPKIGRKAWDKCLDYQHQLIYPCVKGVSLTGEKARAVRCRHGATDLILGGQDTTPREFPHMALLGFGDTEQTAQFLCGGSLVSDRYILTAGHCTSSREYGEVTFALLGAQKRSDPITPANLYRIVERIKHPQYKSPVKYNDIALLKTDRLVSLSEAVVPACIHFGEAVRDARAQATGWGNVEYRGKNADTLQKVTLEKFPTSDCKSQFPPGIRNMEDGFLEATQLCYGDKTQVKDACQGDSGGPLQVQSIRINCMYTIIGVTSFGKACGIVGEAGIYTRVSAYASWIESVLWP